MNKKYFSLFLSFLVLATFSSCRQDEGSQIRNVKFDPNLLNQARDGSSCTSYNYFYNGKEKSLGTIYTRQVLVAFAEGTSFDEQKSAIEEYGFVKGIGNQTSSSSTMLFTIPLAEGLNCSQTEQVLEILRADRIIDYAAPYFVQESNLLGVSNEAIVTVRDGNKKAMDKLLRRYGASLVSSLSSNVYVVKVDKNSEGNALELANLLQGQKGIEHAEPNFVISEIPGAEPVAIRRGIGAGGTRR